MNTEKPLEELNDGHWHEALDRTHCVCEIIQNMLLDHPAIEQTPLLREQVQAAQDMLGMVYQAIGARS